jgi:hypothetical protein
VIDKTNLKRTIDHTKPQDLVVLSVNNVEKNIVSINLNKIEKFMNTRNDYVIVVMKR